MNPIEPVLSTAAFKIGSEFDFNTIQSDFLPNEVLQYDSSKSNATRKDLPLWDRVTTDWYTILVGLCVVVAVSGVAYSILSGVPFAGMGYALLGVVTLYQYYCMMDYKILQSAVDALELSRKSFTQSCYDLKHTTARLETTNKSLHRETETLQRVNADLTRTETGLREVNGDLHVRVTELGLALRTQEAITSTLTDQVGQMSRNNESLKGKLDLIENWDKIYQENFQKLGATQQEYDRVSRELKERSEELRKTEEKLAFTSQLLEAQVARFTSENNRLSQLGDRIENRLAEAAS